MKNRILAILTILSVLASATPALAARSHRSRPAVRDSSESRRLVTEGVAALRAQRFTQAVSLFENATRADSSSAEAFYRLGGAYYQRAFQRGTPEKADRDDAQAAVDAYQTAIALDSSLESVSSPYLLHHGMGLCLQALGRTEEALDAYKKATAAAPGNPMPNLYAAALRYSMRDFDRSQANLELSARRALKLKAYPALAKLVRGNEIFSAMMSAPQNRTVLDLYDQVQAGVISEDEAHGRLSGTVEYRDALRDVPTSADRPAALDAPRVDPRVQDALDRANGQYGAQRFREAVDSYQEALDADARKGTLDAVQRSVVYEKIGSAYRQLGLAGEAIRVLENAVAELPQNSAAYYQLSLCYAISGRLALSLSALNRSLENAASVAELRQTMLLARTDNELEPIRDLPKFREILKTHTGKLSAKR
ncbi:MAG: tetratricopeptide repeat protein [Elusimicrobiota bacterium]|jgi:tetratricopeptide (TPR) repeat protein